jgi:hypothetical protein
MVSPGEPLRKVWTAEFYNRLQEFMNRGVKVTMSGPGFATVTKNGITIALPPPPPSTGGATIAPGPWYPFTTKDGSGNYLANFYAGTIGGVLPTNMMDSISLTQNAKNYLYLEVTASGGVVTGATIAASTSYPTLAAANSGTPPTSFNVPIAIFDLSQTPVAIANIVGYGNIWAQPYIALFDTINTGALLTAPFTPWYNWEWGASY